MTLASTTKSKDTQCTMMCI